MNKQTYPDTDYLRELALKAGTALKNNGSHPPIMWGICDLMHKDFPHIRVVTPHEIRDVQNAVYTVFCDIGMTSIFSEKTVPFTFSIAVLHGDTPLAAVIYTPAEDLIWHAKILKEAYINNAPCRVSRRVDLANAKIALVETENPQVNISTLTDELLSLGAQCKAGYPEAHIGGLIASGTVHAMIFPGSISLQAPAIQCIITTAGGVAFDLDGKALTYENGGRVKGYIMTNGELHKEIRNIVARHRLQ